MTRPSISPRWGSEHPISVVALTLIVPLLGACSQKVASAESLPAGNEPITATLMAQPALALPDEFPEDSNQLRRGYGAVDMRLEACVARDDDAEMLVGKACTSGILVYGPYVSVPANSQVEISFEVRADRTVQVYADMVSQMGKQVLAGLNPQVIAAGQTQKLGYYVSMPKDDTNVESRIGVRTDDPVELVLTNLTMTVR